MNRIGNKFATTMWLWLRLAVCATLVFAAQPADAAAEQSLRLAWDANAESDLAGYRLHYGTASASYTETIDVGNVTLASVSNLTAGVTYFFVVTAYNTSGLESEPSNELSHTTLAAVDAVVAGRHVFYNRSFWDGNNAAADPTDDAAIATDKVALLPGQTATFANYTSYSRGINGIMVDIAGLAGTPTLKDFALKVGNDNTPDGWASAPAPLSISLRSGAGVAGSDRITLIWPDLQITNRWLQVSVKATATTGLAADDVFYFGNAIGETGNSVRDCNVLVNDALKALNRMVTRTGIDDQFDVDRSGSVLVNDALFILNHMVSGSQALQLINLGGSVVEMSSKASVMSYVDQEGLTSAMLSPSENEGPEQGTTANGEGESTEPALRAKLLALEQSSDGSSRLLFEWAGSTPVRVWRSVDLAQSQWEALPEAWVQPQGGQIIAVELPPGAAQSMGFFQFESSR